MSKVVVTTIKKKSIVVKGSDNHDIANRIIKYSEAGCSAYMVKKMDIVEPEPEYTKGVEGGVWDNGQLIEN